MRLSAAKIWHLQFSQFIIDPYGTGNRELCSE